LEHEQAIRSGSFDQALTDSGRFAQPLQAIATLSVDRIYRARPVVEKEVAGFEVLPGLLHDFLLAAEQLVHQNQPTRYRHLARLLPPETVSAVLQQPENAYARIREVIDLVSGLTDSHAVRLYRKIRGVA
jgi:dGTPase